MIRAEMEVLMAEGDSVRVRPEGWRVKTDYVRFSAEVGRVLLARVAEGEPISRIVRDPGMPSQKTVRRWAERSGRFRRLLERAKALGGWSASGRPPAGYCPVTAAAICARLSQGEPMTAICEDPTMPGHSTVYRWRDEQPDFARALERARQVVAERLFDLGWEIARAVTPADVQATRVKLTQLRWMAGAMAPSRFGRFKAVASEAETVWETEAPANPREVRIEVRRFGVDTREDGAQRMFEYRRDPVTNLLTRPDECPPWGPPNPARAGKPFMEPLHRLEGAMR